MNGESDVPQASEEPARREDCNYLQIHYFKFTILQCTVIQKGIVW
jgi:hypothetical protein